jgi:hypothetical protein
MTLLLALFLFVLAVALFMWAYRRHLDVLTGPWIALKSESHDRS